MSKFWNEAVKNISPYVPGEQLNDKKYIKLNTNENPYPPSPKVLEAIKKGVGEGIKLYPNPIVKDAIGSIARNYGVGEKNVFLGNGSDEILAFCFMAFMDKGDNISFPNVTYSFYEVYSEFFGMKVNLMETDENLQIEMSGFGDNNRVYILANPNAPTGQYISVEEIEKFLKEKKDSLLIVDEAYIDFGGESCVNLIDKYDNLLVVQTFSKSRSLAGMRIGMAFGNEELIQGLNRVKNSFNSYTVDTLSIIAAKSAIEDKVYFEKIRNEIISTREWLSNRFSMIGYSYLTSKANFLFVKKYGVSGKKLYEILKYENILVRYFDKEKLKDYVRITIGTREEMEVLLQKLP